MILSFLASVSTFLSRKEATYRLLRVEKREMFLLKNSIVSYGRNVFLCETLSGIMDSVLDNSFVTV